MNMSELITTLKINTGIYVMPLPIENIDKVLEDIIAVKTLPTFSVFCPDIQQVYYNIKELEIVNQAYEESTYLFPDVYNKKKILFIKSAKYKDTGLGGTSIYYGHQVTTGNLVQQAMIMNANAALSSSLVPKMTFKFIPPRTVTLYNTFKCSTVIFELALTHSNVNSIPETARESLIRLATLDIKAFLYNTLKLVPEITTAQGQMNLKIDEWSSAEADRDALIKEWEAVYHIDLNLFEWI